MTDRSLTPAQRRQFVLNAVARQLSTPDRPWRVDGDRVRGPGTIGVVLGDGCDDTAPQHVELGIVLNMDRPDLPVIWDCAVGLSLDEREAITHAVEIWDARTMPVVRELFAQRGEYASHYPPGDPEGLSGWHVIHCPLWGWSVAGEAQMLQQWMMENPMLPLLAPVVVPKFDSPMLNGVRIFLGGTAEHPEAEVRINGRRDANASRLLYDVGWPRPTQPAGISAFALAVHGV